MTEVELITLLTHNIPRRKGDLKVGVGDDCSVIRAGKKDIVISCDSLVEGIHFKRAQASWKTWGAKAAGASLSDIAAMGANPKYAWVHLSLPKNITVKEIRHFYQGMQNAFKKCGTLIAGGNISRSPKDFAATLTVWGEIARGKAMLRSNAKVGDKVFLGGPLGLSSFKPIPQIKLGKWLVSKGCRCCIDVSDGLLKDLGHIAEASKVKIVLFADKIPHRGDLKRALTRGEDYVLAFTGPWGGLRTRDYGLGTEIGFIQRGKPCVQVVDKEGNLLLFAKRGFDHTIET